MKIPQFLEKIINVWKANSKQRPLSAKEKWMLLLLSGVLLAVIIFPSGKKSNDSAGTNSLLGMIDTANGTEGSTLWSAEGTADTSADRAGSSAANLISAAGPGEEILTLKQYEAYLSQELESIISQIDGAGAVEAWVTLSGSSEKVLYLEKNSDTTDLQEADSVGGTRSEKTESMQQTVLLDSSGNPYIVKTLQPEVEGVLVVAEGADSSVVKKNITEAVEVLFGIDAHRIKVAKKKAEE